MSADLDFIPAEAFPPGDFLRDELAERGWTQEVFADIIGKTERLVNEVICAKREITPATAQAFAAALGTSAQFWLNLESSYRLYRESQKRSADESVSRRAKLYSKAPVREMIKRGWIEGTSNIDLLEKRICDFFEIQSVDDEPRFSHAAKKSASYDSVTSSLAAWLHRARQIARLVPPVGVFRKDSVARVVERLRALLQAPTEARHVARLLSEHGIRLVVVEPISGKTKVDGVTFWLDAKSPVIALSIRYDRIDSFWFALLHELGHVEARDGQTDNLPIVDDFDAMKSHDLPDSEKNAHAFASASLIPPEELSDFIARTQPLYSKVKIENFALRIKVHPGIVVGQLQHRHEIDWSHSRNLLVKIRDHVTGSTLTDGWGHVL